MDQKSCICMVQLPNGEKLKEQSVKDLLESLDRLRENYPHAMALVGVTVWHKLPAPPHLLRVLREQLRMLFSGQHGEEADLPEVTRNLLRNFLGENGQIVDPRLRA